MTIVTIVYYTKYNTSNMFQNTDIKPVHDFLSILYWHFLSISYGFRYIRLRSVQGLTLAFDLWKSLEVKHIFSIRKPIHDFLSNFYWHFLSISYRFLDIRNQSFQGLTLIFEFQRSLRVENIFTIQKAIHDFLSNFYWHFLSISYRFRDIRLQSFQGLTLIFEFQRSLKVENIHHSKGHTRLPI